MTDENATWLAKQIAVRLKGFSGRKLTTRIIRDMEWVVQSFARETFKSPRGIPSLNKLTPKVKIRPLRYIEDGRLIRVGRKLRITITTELPGTKVVEVMI